MVVIEIFAAITGASISVAAYAFTGITRRNVESRDSVLRLTMAVESVAEKIQQLHDDFRTDRVEVFGRLNQIEQRIAKLEVKP